MGCSRCGRRDLQLTIVINASTMKSEKLCGVCLNQTGLSGNEKKTTIEVIDQRLADYEKLAKDYEDLISEHPEMPEMPKGLEQFAVTPMSAYKSIQAVIAALKAERMELLAEAGSEMRLNYELKKSLEAEDYAKAAEVRDKLSKMKSKKE